MTRGYKLEKKSGAKCKQPPTKDLRSINTYLALHIIRGCHKRSDEYILRLSLGVGAFEVAPTRDQLASLSLFVGWWAEGSPVSFNDGPRPKAGSISTSADGVIISLISLTDFIDTPHIFYILEHQ